MRGFRFVLLIDRLSEAFFGDRRGQFGILVHRHNDSLMRAFPVPDVVLQHEDDVEEDAHQTQNQFGRNSSVTISYYMLSAPFPSAYPLMPSMSPLEKASKNSCAIDKIPPAKSKITF